MLAPGLENNTGNAIPIPIPQRPPCPRLRKDHHKWLIERHMVNFIQNKEQAQVKLTTGKPVRGPGVKYVRKFILNDFIDAFFWTQENEPNTASVFVKVTKFFANHCKDFVNKSQDQKAAIKEKMRSLLGGSDDDKSVLDAYREVCVADRFVSRFKVHSALKTWKAIPDNDLQSEEQHLAFLTWAARGFDADKETTPHEQQNTTSMAMPTKDHKKKASKKSAEEESIAVARRADEEVKEVEVAAKQAEEKKAKEVEAAMKRAEDDGGEDVEAAENKAAPALTRAQKAAATRAANALKKEAAQAKRQATRTANASGTKCKSSSDGTDNGEDGPRHSKRGKPTNGGQLDSLDTISDDEEEPKTPTHTLHHCNLDNNPSDNQPDNPNSLRGPGRPIGPGGPGGPGGPNDPGGPGGPNNGPNKQDFLQEFMNLLRRVSTMLNNPQPNPVHTKVKEPDTFDGSDLQKLKAFIVSLQLNFNDRPTAFTMDASKVNYTISFLSGTALN
ncbi:hypothetical protein EV421DRAFT_1914608 [Armillaria borealis]|uniref:Uncharacterized protein n=1 Tax=Armillaria borealis TaxID=47425 RepID=A0AA39IV42_9AGAR|nr:hypothetical protein EV421DRAFT_1914608 [Armillaria borealis]